VTKHAQPASFAPRKYVGRPFVGAKRIAFEMTVVGYAPGQNGGVFVYSHSRFADKLHRFVRQIAGFDER
jgi:hypothetical protein